MSKQGHSLRVRQTWAVGLIPQGWLTLPSLDVSTLQNSLYFLWGEPLAKVFFGVIFHFCPDRPELRLTA
jgi:hypothetical protein